MQAPASAVERAVLAASDLMPRGATVLVACSGGPDSVALAAAVARQAGALGIRAALGHVDHALRPESGREVEQVAGVAARLALPFHAARIENIQTGELGLEAAARQARYAALATLAERAGADRVATAHTRRDQAETVLLRLARGGGPGALAGIRRSRPLTGRILLIRPLLGVAREETEQLCAALELPVLRDPHNADPRRARTRVRGLFPRLAAALNPRLEESLAGAARLAADEDAFLQALARDALHAAAAGGGFSTEALARLPPALLRRALLIASHGAAQPERHHLDALAGFLPRTGTIDLPGGRAIVECGILRFERGRASPPPEPLQISGPGIYAWGGRTLRVGEGTQQADLLLAPFPWTVRTRNPGDRLRMPGRPQASLRELWSSAGVPPSRRSRLAVFADAEGRVFWAERLPPSPDCITPLRSPVRFDFGPEMDGLR